MNPLGMASDIGSGNVEVGNQVVNISVEIIQLS
jgi:hypothetical protein